MAAVDDLQDSKGHETITISMQPTSGGSANATPPGGQPTLMAAPASIPGVPLGLEYLTQIDQLLIHQQVEIFEALTGWETNNKYQIKNSLGQQVYFAAEESDVFMRQFCGPSRGFVMHITNNFGQEVIRVVRDFKCCSGCNWCANIAHCSMDIRIEAPVGQVIGYMRQTQSCWMTKYVIEDAQQNPVFTIDGPCCPCQGLCCTADIEFPILSADSQRSQVGVVSKQWAGVLREMIVDADNFSVSFPIDLDVRMKATLLGAVFLIDFMFFEQKNDNNNN